MKEVRISRKRWCRGGRGDAALRTESGQSCCLGFVARSYGLKTPVGAGSFSYLTDDLYGKQDCSVLPSAIRPLKRGGQYYDTRLVSQLADANDSIALNGIKREEKITRLLAKAGIRVVFVD